jgi:hypothetical protein
MEGTFSTCETSKTDLDNCFDLAEMGRSGAAPVHEFNERWKLSQELLRRGNY